MTSTKVTLFAVARSGQDIEPREYDRVTDKCAFYTAHGRECRELRHQEYLHLFDTEAEAVAYVRDRLERTLSSARSIVDCAGDIPMERS